MKTKNKFQMLVSFTFITSLSVLTLGCSPDDLDEDDVAPKSNKKEEVFSIESGDIPHDSLILQDSSYLFTQITEEIPTTDDIVMFNDMLHFEDMDAFSTLFLTMDNYYESVLDDWESEFSGFESLRRYYEDLFLSTGDDDEFMNKPIDTYFLTILNEDRKLRIENTVYAYNDELNELTMYLVNGEDIEEEPHDIQSFDGSALTFTGLLDSDFKSSNSRYVNWNSSVRIYGFKAVIHRGIYSKIVL